MQRPIGRDGEEREEEKTVDEKKVCLSGLGWVGERAKFGCCAGLQAPLVRPGTASDDDGDANDNDSDASPRISLGLIVPILLSRRCAATLFLSSGAAAWPRRLKQVDSAASAAPPSSQLSSDLGG